LNTLNTATAWRNASFDFQRPTNAVDNLVMAAISSADKGKS
jgi:hypothetical protein